MDEPFCLVIADSDEAVRAAVTFAVEHANSIDLIGQVTASRELTSTSQQLRPDILIVAGELLGPDPNDTITKLLNIKPTMKIIVLALWLTPNQEKQLLDAGATMVHQKSSPNTGWLSFVNHDNQSNRGAVEA